MASMNVEINLLLESLNDRQREAVLAGDGPVLVVAGPGTGKTKTLTVRLAVPAGRAARRTRGITGRDLYHAGCERNA